jgi:2-polyprenyl-3-methyl-5-hydroxy-6-metoxy-1,4-benzoquinol methylase
MFEELVEINSRPAPFECYTAKDLWTDDHTSRKMLEYHLDQSLDMASRTEEFIDRSVKWMVSRFCVGKDTVVADFGCGPGLYTTRFAEAGANVTGIDFSDRSIRHAVAAAKRQGLDIEYVCQDYLTFETEQRFDLITMIMCDFCALSPTQRREVLLKFSKLLNVDGSVMLDVYSLNAFEEREEAATYEYLQLAGFWSPNPYYGFLNTFKYQAESVVLDKYTIVEAAGMRTVYNWLQYFSPESLAREFEENGLQVREYYADVAGTPLSPTSGEFAVVAGKV